MEENISHHADYFKQLIPISKKSLKELSIGFFIDTSGSTGGLFAYHHTILDVEIKLVKNLMNGLEKNAKLVSWNRIAEKISDLSKVSFSGETVPSAIFEYTPEIVKEIEVAVIITDGHIGIHEINNFANQMIKNAIHLKSIIGIIVGRRTCSGGSNLNSLDNLNFLKPSEINISVLAPAMISNACILFHNFKSNYILWSCGAFHEQWNPAEIKKESEINKVIKDDVWDYVSTISIEQIQHIIIPIYSEEEHHHLVVNGYLPFGSGNYFNPEVFLQSNPTWEELLNLPFHRICQYFRINNTYQKLFDWFDIQKNKFIKEFIFNDQDQKLIDDFLKAKLGNKNLEKNTLTTYISARNHALYVRHLENQIDDQEIEINLNNPLAIKLFNFFRYMLRIIKEDIQTINIPSTYVSSTISISRYITPQFVTNSKQSIISMSNAIFSEPLKWYQHFNTLFKCHGSLMTECTICLENDIPFFLIRKIIDKYNLEELINSPFNFYYPQVVCCKCADYFCIRKLDPVNMFCFAAIPIVNLICNEKEDSRKNYMENFAKLTNCIVDFDAFDDFHRLPLPQPYLLLDKNLENILFIRDLFVVMLKKQFEENDEISKAINQFDQSFK